MAFVEFRYRVPPEHHRFENVGFVYGSDLVSSFPGYLKSRFRHAFYLGSRVAESVKRLALLFAEVFRSSRMSEVYPACKLPHHHYVDPFDDFPFERGRLGKGRVNDRGSQVREGVEPLSQFKQSSFGFQVVLKVLPFRASHGSEKHRVAFLRSFYGLFRYRDAVGVYGASAEKIAFKREFNSVSLADGLEYRHADFGYFDSYPVSRDYQYLGHFSVFLCVCDFFRALTYLNRR